MRTFLHGLITNVVAPEEQRNQFLASLLNDMLVLTSALLFTTCSHPFYDCNWKPHLLLSETRVHSGTAVVCSASYAAVNVASPLVVRLCRLFPRRMST